MSNGTTGSTGTAGSALGASGGTSTAGLAPWAAGYITDYLGKAQALANQPYQTYKGPLTAGTSALQSQAFQGVGSLTVPREITDAAQTAAQLGNVAAGMSYKPTTFSSTFTAPSAFQAGQFSSMFNAPQAYDVQQFKNLFTAPQNYIPVGGSFTEEGIAGKYMNPYLEQTLQPQLKELQRQSAINLMPQLAKLTQAGGYGGSREAILRGEAQRNLLDQVAQTTGQTYNTAFQQAQQQFNAEQQRKIQEAQFASQQGMSSAEIAARYGLEAARATEQSRQFAAQQRMTGADLSARYAQEAQRAAEQSRQFASQQQMTAAQSAAQYAAEAQRASEQSRQFGSRFGLDALQQQMEAARLRGEFGTRASDIQRANLAQQLAAGAAQRAIQQEGIAADLAEFNAQREFPYKQLQFQRDMIAGLPTGSVTNTPPQLSGIAQLITAAGGLDALLKQTGQKSLTDVLKNLGLNLGG